MTRLLLIAALAVPVLGQPTASISPRAVHLGELLNLVAQTNLDLAANRYNVSIAEAQIAIARVRPDPGLSVGPSSVNGLGAPVTLSVGVAETVELGGKRGARIAEARRGRSLAEAQLEDFFQTLRMNATNAFIDALAARQILDRKRRTLQSVEKLVMATEQRLQAGDVSATALWQVKVEAERFRSEVITAEGDVLAADYALELFIGTEKGAASGQLQPAGELLISPRTFDADLLVREALERRSDLVVSLRSEEVAQAHVNVARANRWIDLSLGADWAHTSAASSTFATIAPSLPFDSYGVSVGFPLPFSRLLHGELDAAKTAAAQAEMQSQSTRRRVEIEVRQALARYEATRRSVSVYTGEILGNADRAVDATRYSYERGAARLIELLDAQRTVDDVYLSYVTALANNAKALVALEPASARWDVDF